MNTGIVRDPIYIEHEMGPYHPESPERLISLYAMLDEPDMAGRLTPVPIREGTKEEICWVHNESYYERIKSTRGTHTVLDPDTSTSPQSFDAAIRAVGGTLNAVDMIFQGQMDNGFSLIRPPGHHAEASRAMGFCLFNNVAVAAEYAMHHHGCQKVAIVDWDIHHGNGTQNTFYSSDRVLYASTHQYPFYPGSGDFSEVGWGEGEGTTLNVPLGPGYGDGDFFQIFKKIIKPVLIEFNPDLLLISAGFDTYVQDPIGGMRVTPEGFGGMLHLLMEAAEASCAGKVLAVLEGGYNVDGQTASVKNCLQIMGLPPNQCHAFSFSPEQPEPLSAIIDRVRDIQKPYWKSL